MDWEELGLGRYDKNKLFKILKKVIDFSYNFFKKMQKYQPNSEGFMWQ